MTEGAVISQRDYINFPTKAVPCHLACAHISFYTGGELTTAKQTIEALKRLGRNLRVPIIYICIRDAEAQKYQLARDILKEPCLLLYSGPNTFYTDKHIFHDMFFLTGAT